jgi:RNA polymerase sigma-70 factor (ECF subfamily)
MGAVAVRLPAVRRLSWPRLRSVAADDDAAVVEALRDGDEQAFAALIDLYHGSLVRVASMYVQDRQTAEEVAQETWLAVFEGIERFEGRASLKTWIFKILTNRAKTRAERDGRQVPISSLAGGDEPEVDPDRFLPPDHPSTPLAWAAPPRAWPEDRLLAAETVEVVREAIGDLPHAQKLVIGLRDAEGWSPEDVCRALEISDGNQRVLLHRARSHVRRALEDYMGRT